MTRVQYLQTLFETYTLVTVLADKNGCRVLRVRHKTLGRDMVVRSFPRPVAAYETLCGIRCDDLPEIYDVLTLDDGQLVLEEYIDGVTVAEAMDIALYRPREARQILRAVCNALHVLHHYGFVHRDIKPENVMLDAAGRVLLIDLNASRQLSAASRDTVIMGTVGYASPEQLGLSQSDARTDIYAMGVLLNVMLTGEHPSKRIARGAAGRIVKKCTHIHPDDRYQTVEQLAAALHCP